MNLIRGFLSTAAAGLILAACAALPPASSPSGPAPAGSPTPPPASPTGPTSPAAGAALKALAAQLNLDPSAITIVSVTPQDWPDGCLGLPSPGEMCAMHVVPGYRVVLQAGQVTHTYRTDQGGSEVRPEKPQFGPTPGSAQLPEGLLASIAGQLQQSPSGVSLVSAEPVEWPDACLGVSTPGTVCAQVITPGYRVIVSAGGAQYEFHTNQSGSVVRQAGNAPGPLGTPGTLLEWTGPGAPCQVVSFSLQAVSTAACPGGSETPTSTPFAPGLRTAELAALAASYRAFSADTPAGRVVFSGHGRQVATPAEQRSIAEWARQAVSEVSAAQPAAITWRRVGGIAGFCDELSLYLSGFGCPTSCKTTQSRDLGRTRLASDQLEQLYTWIDEFQPFDLHTGDMSVADGMTIDLHFAGQGSTPASSADQQAILQFAAQVFATAGQG